MANLKPETIRKSLHNEEPPENVKFLHIYKFRGETHKYWSWGL